MRMHNLAIAGLAVGLLVIAASPAQAQVIYRSGSYNNVYTPGYAPGNQYPHSSNYYGYSPGYGYGSYNSGYYPEYGRSTYYPNYYYGNRRVIVHPTTTHWTPGRGWHTHGHIHVPHRDHYHTRPY